MKKIFSKKGCIAFIIFISLTNVCFAQIKFKSGIVELENNITTFFESQKFTSSAFDSKHYIIIQFDKIPTYEERENLKSNGIYLIDYLPEKSYTASLFENCNINLAVQLGANSFYVMSTEQKMERALYQNEIPEWAKVGEDKVDVEIVLIDKISLEKLFPSIQKYNAEVLNYKENYRKLSIRVSLNDLKTIANEPWVMWMEAKHINVVPENIPGKINHRSAIINDGIRNLSGLGVNVGMCDAGKAGSHLDYDNRLTQIDGSSANSHTCHVVGTLGGRGLINPIARGMAPDAKLFSYTFSGDRIAKVQAAIDSFGIVISSNSYGGNHTCTGDPYTAQSRDEDLIVNNNPNLVFVFSSGNDQSSCSGGFNTLTEKATKNTIVVGNVSDLDVLAGDSSFGPTEDGRIKPEVASVGRSVYSTYPGNAYSQKSGTSMATPGVSGVSAQLIQKYRQLNNGTSPKASLVKALLCNSAYDLGVSGPDYKYGFGRINALKSIEAIEQSNYLMDNISNNVTKEITLNVPNGTEELKVLLCWNDPAAAANVKPALVNNLNLEILDPLNNVWHPWVLNGASPASAAVRMRDSINPTEQITIANPIAGTYKVRVKGEAIATGPNQEYALVWELNSQYIKVIHPSGNEMLSPGSTAIVYWDRTNLSSNQTIEFSADSGATWSIVTNTLAANSNKYTWTVPNVFTSKALIKISSGSVSNVSELPFTIIGVPTNLTLSSAPCGIKVDWTTVANATGYDVLLLDTMNGIWNVVGANVSTNTFVIGGLNAGTRYWITVRSRNASKNIIGERARATYFVNQNNGLAATVIINGLNLSTQTAVAYQWLLNGIIIPGATNQNYTASQNGMYSVTITNASGCVVTSAPVPVFTLGTVDIESETNINVFPNPTNGLFIIEVERIEKNAEIILSDILGKEIKKIELNNSSKITIDISSYSSGIYFVSLKNNQKRIVKKLVKQ